MSQDQDRIPGADDGLGASSVSTTQVAREEPLPDTTYAELQEIAARYPQPRSGLLPMLHLVQSAEGQVTSRGIEACAEILGISAAEVSGVATFYTMYKRRPVGDYHVGVCTNTLCAIMGGDLIFERLKDHLEIGNDETTERRPGDRARHPRAHRVQRGLRLRAGDDGQLGVHGQHDPAVGHATSSTTCAPAPRSHRPRGPRLTTWREAERVLAGFPDDLADEGPSAGPASLVGLELATRARLDRPQRRQAQEAARADRAEGETTDDKAAGSHEAEHLDSEAAVEESGADAKHEDNPANPGGDDK